jgi:hypothetical protein
MISIYYGRDFNLLLGPLPPPDFEIFIRKRRIAERVDQGGLHVFKIRCSIKKCVALIELPMQEAVYPLPLPVHRCAPLEISESCPRLFGRAAYTAS